MVRSSAAQGAILVTGASHGIGRGIAERLGGDGARVGVNHLGAAAEAAEVVAAIEAGGGTAIAVEADVSDPDQVTAMVAAAEDALGPLVALVNNAGVSSHVPFLELEVQEWDRVLATNLRGVFLCCRQVAGGMVERGSGLIINIASELAYVGAERLTHYCASKGGVISFSKALARELAPDVRVNVVAPGPIETTMLTRFPDEYNDETLATIPLGRWGKPEDVAGTVAFLAGEDASYYTGWVLSPNGGVVM